MRDIPAHDLDAWSLLLRRRAFLFSSAAAVSAWSLWPTTPASAARRRVAVSDYPFQLGVASGDPTPSGVVIWTRLAPKPLEGGGMQAEPVEVDWMVCDDEQMTKVVKKGRVTASPEMAHAVHVEVEGLQPGRKYFYQFRAAGEMSPVGRTGTAPALDAMPGKVRFGFASCQHFEQGLYTAYERAAQEDYDLFFHLGDYIYEYAGRDKLVRKHVGPEITTIDDYRTRLAQYRTDEHLQAAHASCPWLVTWDDHEFDNNYANEISEEAGVNPEEFLKRRANAYKAYYEHMPLRRRSVPQGPHMTLYRRVPWGRLAEFDVLDTRQYRTDQPCGDGNKTPCKAVFDPKATLLGDAQEKWLMDALAASPARWNVLAQQVMMGRADRALGDEFKISMDQWSGYHANRTRLLKFFEEQKISNPVVLTGDIHSNWVNDLLVDFDQPESKPVGTEFVTTSISSGGNGSESLDYAKQLQSENPFVKFFNAERGYVQCEVTPQSWKSDYLVVSDVTKPGGRVFSRASFVVENGRPGAEKV